MAKAKKNENIEPKEMAGFVICNRSKLDRVINGTVGADGKLEGGIGADASEEAILAEYDRLGGLIRTADGEKVATGSFYDFENRCARTNPTAKVERASRRGGAVNVEKVSGPDSEEEPKKGKKAKKAAESDEE